MNRPEALGYGVARLAFGLGVMVAPERMGLLMIGDDARDAPVRISVRFYGTRDVVLGLGALRAALGGDDVRPWVAAGMAADVLDTVVQVGEWGDLPPGRRGLGVLSAAGAAAAGGWLLARG